MRGGGGVQTPPKKDDTICEHPLSSPPQILHLISVGFCHTAQWHLWPLTLHFLAGILHSYPHLKVSRNVVCLRKCLMRFSCFFYVVFRKYCNVFSQCCWATDYTPMRWCFAMFYCLLSNIYLLLSTVYSICQLSTVYWKYEGFEHRSLR